jgi:ferredoxin--NADP+ reductase
MGFQMIQKREIAPDIFQLRILAPLVAKAARAGQFVVVRADSVAERIPLTIMDVDAAEGFVDLVVQVIGTSTRKLCDIGQGNTVLDIAGPLGKPSDIPSKKTALVIGGGVGIAAIAPIAQALKKNGNSITAVLGARNRKYLILKDRINHMVDRLVCTTDDGSEGIRGTVTAGMDFLQNQKVRFDQGWAIGPTIMMKFVSQKAQSMGLPIWTSLNPIMIDGTGMCGGCRVMVNGKIRYACVDGPEFEGSLVDWDNLILRQKQFASQEKESFTICKGSKIDEANQ